VDVAAADQLGAAQGLRAAKDVPHTVQAIE
jgi:hypothetical protein